MQHPSACRWRGKGVHRRLLFPETSLVASSPPLQSGEPRRLQWGVCIHHRYYSRALGHVGTDRESPSCACEEKGEGGAGIRLMILYFHCIIWHHRGPVSRFASQACGGSRKDCARWLRRPVPAPRPTLASPAPAPHCLEPDDQAAVATIPGTRWLVGGRP